MPLVVSDVDTILRDPSAKLSPVDVKASTRLGVEIFPANGQMLEFVLAGKAGNLAEGSRWLAYGPHWKMPANWKPRVAAPKSIKLSVPYFAQCDTRQDGWRYCFSHSVAMAAFFLKPSLFEEAKKQGYDQPEQLHIARLTGDSTDPNAQLGALEKSGIKAYYTQTVSPKDLYELLEAGVPVPIGVAYKLDGHWICCVGIQGSDWLDHDPYGVRSGTQSFYATTSTDRNKLGAFDRYSQVVMDGLYWDLAPDARKESGWAIVITEVDGKPTGAKLGL